MSELKRARPYSVYLTKVRYRKIAWRSAIIISKHFIFDIGMPDYIHIYIERTCRFSPIAASDSSYYRTVSVCQADRLVKACEIASRCRWCGEKLNLTNVFFSVMKTALSIIRFMKLSMVKTSTSVLEVCSNAGTRSLACYCGCLWQWTWCWHPCRWLRFLQLPSACMSMTWLCTRNCSNGVRQHGDVRNPPWHDAIACRVVNVEYDFTWSLVEGWHIILDKQLGYCP